MNNDHTLKILEALASKICHDLISPIGAVSNGVEILEELGEAGSDVTGLISFSATQANAKLKALRMVYGLGGADESIKPEEVHTVFGDLISGDKRLSQDWDPYQPLAIPSRTGLSKTLLAGLMLLGEGLPKGGVISIENDTNSIHIVGNGENAQLKEEHIGALNQKIKITDLSPKYIHAYVTGMLAQHYNFDLTIDQSKQGFIALILK